MVRPFGSPTTLTPTFDGTNTSEPLANLITNVIFPVEALMSSNEGEDNTIYKVVINHQEQYSIWPADRENALGWTDVGKQGSKVECLAYIKEVWTDMRPLSLRKAMAESSS